VVDSDRQPVFIVEKLIPALEIPVTHKVISELREETTSFLFDLIRPSNAGYDFAAFV
jgi:hypothetical protein